ncbi:MAG: CAP domain-containing protein [Desulfofustis sp.]|nr:CAP domain-containing protein [Desulfofustis sp.]
MDQPVCSIQQGLPMNICRFAITYPTLIVYILSPSLLSAGYQCDINGDYRLGLAETIAFLQTISGANAEGPETVLICGTPTYDITASGILNPAAQHYILCRMNQIRSETALGLTPDNGSSDFYPLAADMQRMRWDENLATVARLYAAQCIFEHNSNRHDDYAGLTGIVDPVVGENIAGTGISWTIGSTEAVEAIEAAFDGWNDESTLWYYDTMNDNSWAAGIGHFTQNVWASSTRVGCGQAWCPNRSLDGSNYNVIFTVCNFYPTGNYWGHYPYQSSSEVCSNASPPDNTCENGLVTPNDYDAGIPFECDVNGDERIGLEEVINALRILSGITTE